MPGAGLQASSAKPQSMPRLRGNAWKVRANFMKKKGGASDKFFLEGDHLRGLMIYHFVSSVYPLK